MLIEILLGPEDGNKKEIEADRVVFGREAQCDVFFPYARKVSASHASIIKEGNGYFLVDHGNDDKGSTNGTVILRKSGSQVKIWKDKKDPPFPGEPVSIEEGDVVILGDSIWFKFLGG